MSDCSLPNKIRGSLLVGSIPDVYPSQRKKSSRYLSRGEVSLKYMIEEREECVSNLLKPSYDQMIEEQKVSIAQLEYKLNGFTY